MYTNIDFKHFSVKITGNIQFNKQNNLQKLADLPKPASQVDERKQCTVQDREVPGTEQQNQAARNVTRSQPEPLTRLYRQLLEYV